MIMKLTDASVKKLEAPERGNRIHYDTEVKGFGVRVTAKGSRAFVLNYRTRAGRERRITIGSFPDWTTGAARAEAADLKRRVDGGDDPLGEVEADRGAKTVADLCQRYTAEQLPRLREGSQRDYAALIRRFILPELKHKTVAEVAFADIDGLHRKVTKSSGPYTANRMLAVASRMFALSIRWQWRTDNPCRGVERNTEEKRHRYLSGDELARLTQALAEHDDQQAANIVRLLLLTGARRGETQAARWADFDLAAGVWTKPGATTKQKSMHRVPLNAPARQLLAALREDAPAGAEYVFPGRGGEGHRQEIKTAWRRLCIAAGIVTAGKPSARLHDLRHTYASVLASAGLSLPVIGALLGHTQPATTARYAHLLDDPLRAATERAGAIVMPTAGSGEILKLRG
ncbi:MAG: site-specific integrase [Alphaproteobacteria bacterium]|nr:site-specific integrase [Alphaproteobacteria bacterium]